MIMPEKPTYEELEQKVSDLEAKCAQYIKTETDLTKTLSHNESRLKESEKSFKLMADYTHSWEYWLGPDSKLHYVSPSCKNFTGYSRKEFKQDDELLLNIIHPDDKEDLVKHFKHETQAPMVESMEFRIIDRSGKIRWLSHTCQPVYDENHAFLGRRASNREITEQKEAELQRDRLTDNLSKTSTLLNTVLDAIPDVIGVQDPHHNIIRYNRAGYRFLDREPSEVHGKKCYELIGHEMPCHICATSEVYKTKKPAQVVKYVEELETWLDVRAYPVVDENSKITQVIEHLRDISKEKTAEKKLIEAHERLTTILDSIDAHIYVADMESFKILFMNKNMVDAFDADFTGKKCYASFRNESKPCEHCTNKFLLGKNNNPSGGHTWECKNPITDRWYINFDRAIKWGDGRTVRIQIATDITDAKNNENERLRMEQQLLQAQKYEAIGTLAGGIAHDFNNLLMGIQGWVSLMSADLESSHPFAEKINSIEEYIRSATDLTKQLLGFARGGKYEVLPIDINTLLFDSATMFGRTKKEISIHTKFQDPPPVVKADKRQIEQVLLNLYVNAWQAMPKNGELYLETSTVDLDATYCSAYSAKPGCYVKISVTDNGVGMDKQILQRIFDPSFTTKKKDRGTGLGLASTYGIIKNHSGIITVYSEVGHGTTFNVYLPVSDEKIKEKLSKLTEFVKGSETILLVDDEEMIITVGQGMLEKLGYHVLTASGGEQAVGMISEKGSDIDLVVLDLIMPGFSGAKTFDAIREIHPQKPIMLSSGYSINGQATEIMNKGCNGFLQKPFTLVKLSKKIRKILDDANSANKS